MWNIIGKVAMSLLPLLIHRAETANPGPGQGKTKAHEVAEVIYTMAQAFPGGVSLLTRPKVAEALSAARDAIVAFQNALAAESKDTPA